MIKVRLNNGPEQYIHTIVLVLFIVMFVLIAVFIGFGLGVRNPKWVQYPVSGDVVFVQFETKAFTDSEFTIPTEYIPPMSHLSVVANEGGRLYVSLDERNVWIRWSPFEMATIPKIPKAKQ